MAFATPHRTSQLRTYLPITPADCLHNPRHISWHFLPAAHLGTPPSPEELADVLIYVCAIANRFGISLDEALRKKEAIDETRTWL